MPRLQIKDFAQFGDADVRFGDLTLLVGPQATGKSLLLQLLKYSIDRPVIARQMTQNGMQWGHDSKFGLLSAYLGEGYEAAFSKRTHIAYDGHELYTDEKKLRSSARPPKVLFIPAQRVMAMQSGWPRPFMGFDPGDAFVVRQFSQDLLEQFSRGLGRSRDPGKGEGAIFPHPDRLKGAIRKSIEDTIFHGGQVILKSEGGRRRLFIKYQSANSGSIELPFMEWSAGQREFAPLLLGLYQLLPAGKVTSHINYEWVIIEEPEMGLHPYAINAVMLLVFELMHRGYKVCISTHSTYILELVWAINALREAPKARASTAFLSAARQTGNALRDVATSVLSKNIKTYALWFDESKRHDCADISGLALDDTNSIVSSWGGITELSRGIADAVARGL